ncbi:MAG: hypothetical protein J1F27_04980 [Prevotellaceae bacterium]|nr:hypothetical protein [Prevotellaceae bacterium]
MKTTDFNTDALETKLVERFGTETPFTTPDGYFKELPSRVMNRIAQRRRRRMIWRWAVAAMFVGCMWTGGMFLGHTENDTIAESVDIQYIEEALNYSMIDNMSIASYLTEVE